MPIIHTGTGATILPKGTTNERPTPEAGSFRYNIDYDIVEFYNGTKWIAGQGYTPETAVTDPKDILVNSPNSPSGIYWLKDASNNPFQYFIDNENNGGGWIRAQSTIGTFTSAITSSWGTGGGNHLSGASNEEFGTVNLNADNVTNSQAVSFGCPGAPQRSRITLSPVVYDYFNITEGIFVYNNVAYPNGTVTCGYLYTGAIDFVILQGTAQMNSTCNNSPNTFSDLNPTSFTFKLKFTINTVANGDRPQYTLFDTWTACSGSIQGNISELWIR